MMESDISVSLSSHIHQPHKFLLNAVWLHALPAVTIHDRFPRVTALGEAVSVEELTDIAAAYPEMMDDCYRYETVVELPDVFSAILVIDYMSAGAEVFVNDISFGRRIAPDQVYDITSTVHPGKNRLKIDMAVRAEGIIGKVKLYSVTVLQRGKCLR